MTLRPAVPDIFARWFGQSRAVDAHGQPLVLYHGTRAVFETFDTSKTQDDAHWFVADEDHAATFGPARPYVLRLLNPMVIHQDDLEAAMDEDPASHDDDALLPRHYVADFVQVARRLGHDGLIIREMDDRDGQFDMYLAFEPEQILLAERCGIDRRQVAVQQVEVQEEDVDASTFRP